MSTTTASQGKTERKNAPGNQSGIGWGHGVEVDPKKKTIRCKYCSVVRGGGDLQVEASFGRHSVQFEALFESTR